MTTSDRLSGRRRQLAVLVLFAALAVAHTWPLALAPGTYARVDNDDTVLNTWALAWVAHQAVTHPAHLFDANIFYPEPRTLAYSEHLLPQAALVAPLLWAGASPVLAHNVALLLGLALTGWVMSWVVARWTGSLPAGILAGALAAFNAHSLTRLSHLQAQHVEFLPLALLALDRLLSEPRARHALQTALWFALQAMASGYFLVFSAVALIAGAASRPQDWLGARARRFVAYGTLAAAAAGVLLLPTLWPYWRVRTDAGLVRSVNEAALFAASLTDYLATGARVHFESWSRPFFKADALFPGVVALALACVALATRVAWRDVRARMCLTAAAVAFLLSFGPHLPGYAWLHEHLPLLQGIRGTARFGHLALVMLAAVAGFGLAALLGRLSTARGRLAVAVLVIAATTAEAWRAPLAYPEFRGIAPVYDRLAAYPDAVFVHLPMYSRRFVHANSAYMLGSTRHWRPMLNGFSGFIPASYMANLDQLGGFPDDRSLTRLQALGVTHVVVHEEDLPAERVERARVAPGLELLAVDGTVRIYALVR